jgi:zinc transporter 1/2/3
MNPHHMVFTVLKQFGTGVIISTAFIHLYTHATFMFANDCLGELSYEATTSAIVMAGILVSFMIECGGRRLVAWRQSKRSLAEASEASTVTENVQSKEAAAVVRHGCHGFGDLKKVDKLSVIVLEAGLIFHSVRKSHILPSLHVHTNWAQSLA